MAANRENFKALPQDSGLWVPKQSLMVLEAAASCTEEHLAAEEIFELVKVDCPDIGPATFYAQPHADEICR